LRLFAAVTLIACIASRAAAEETPEELMKRLGAEGAPWKGCGPGSWIQARSVTKSATGESTSEYRQTLVKRDKTGVTVETRTVRHVTGADGKDAVELGEAHSSVLPGPLASRYENLKDDRHEDVTVGGKVFPCRVLTCTWIYPMSMPGSTVKTEYRASMTYWYSDAVSAHGGLVKIHGEPDNKAGCATSKIDSELIEDGKELKIGDRTVTCSVSRQVTVSTDGKTTSTVETWISPDVPAGYAKTTMETTFVNGAATTKTEVSSEVTGMEIVPEKKD
jgi:hypothetical protein